MEKKQGRPVAIVGYAFRLPGGLTDGPEFWGALCEGRDLVGKVQGSRWAMDRFYHPERSEQGTSYTFTAGSLGEVGEFDAAFFGISPREAEEMDPQQRLLLELTWEALENGGIRPTMVRGSQTGVFIGCSSTDYAYRRADDLSSVDAYTMTGNTASIIANRISYLFDLHGPSMVIDTACSSSLVAFHQACQAIRSGECGLALSGGVSLHLHPFPFVGFSKASMLSRQGACKVFDASADGYVRSEGGGIFILKDLDAALADGNPIFAVVRASAVNSDGKTQGLTVPGKDAQADLLRGLYFDKAGIAAGVIDYVEAHGTGTAVGDPIEAAAIGEAIGLCRLADSPLPIGSVKSNIGHLEAASGVAGLVKVLLCIQHRAIPPSIHFKNPNPSVHFDDLNLKVVNSLTTLDPQKALVIGINSFGFGGTNAHAILESPPVLDRVASRSGKSGWTLPPLFISARTQTALRMVAGQYAEYLSGVGDDSAYYDVAWAASQLRDFQEFRAIAFGAEKAAVGSVLADFACGREAAAMYLEVGHAVRGPCGTAFVYSGNGSQWAGMGQTLLLCDPVFREAVEAVDSLFLEHADFSILEELQRPADAARLHQTEIAQPLLFAVQVGITQMLLAMGLAPAAVVGHSVGEVAAAWAAGALTLEQAVRVIAVRSARQGTTRGDWGMTAVGLDASAILAILDELELGDCVSLAGINSTNGVTLAGRSGDLDTLEKSLAAQDVFHRRLGFDYAFHSPAMDGLKSGILSDLADLRPGVSKIPFISTVTGEEMDGSGLDACYWWQNVREPVQFRTAIQSMLDRGSRIFIEVGPHAVLRGYVKELLRENGVDGRLMATMFRSDDSQVLVQRAFYQAVIAGAPFDMRAVFPVAGKFVALPNYPWERQYYWHPVTSEGYGLINRKKEHPLLGYRLSENEGQWENHLDAMAYPLFRDHVVGGAVVFPFAGFVEMALAAARLTHPGVCHEIDEFVVRAPLLLDENGAKTVRFNLNADGGFTLKSRPRLSDEAWVPHVVGRLQENTTSSLRIEPRSAEISERAPDLSAEQHYRLAGQLGLLYGSAFQAVSKVWLDGERFEAGLVTPAAIAPELNDYQLHPSFLDACFQLLIGVLRDENNPGHMAFLPVSLDRLVLYMPGVEAGHVEGRIRRRHVKSILADFAVFDIHGQRIADVFGIRLRAAQLVQPPDHKLDILTVCSVPSPRRGHYPGCLLPPVEAVAARLVQWLYHPARLLDRQRYFDEVEPLLDALLLSFVEEALRDPGVTGAEGAWTSALAGRNAKVLRYRLLQMMEEDGILERTEGDLRWADTEAAVGPRDIWFSLMADYPDYGAEILQLGRIGMHLPALLSGCTSDPLWWQQQASGASAMKASADPVSALVELVRILAEPLPEGQRLHVLELRPDKDRRPCLIHALTMLDSDRFRYVIAGPDLSDHEDLTALQRNFPNLEWQTLNPDLPPADMELFPARRFDLILLPNGFAAAQAGAVLSHVRSLLANDGLLAVIEWQPSRIAELMALFAACAAGEIESVSQLRRRYPGHYWKSMLEAQGFHNVVLLPETPDEVVGASVLIARHEYRLTSPLAATPNCEAGCWILLQDEAGCSAELGTALASELRRRQQHVLVATTDRFFGLADDGSCRVDPCSTADLSIMLKHCREQWGHIAGVVHLGGMDAGTAIEESAVYLDRITERCLSITRLLEAGETLQNDCAYWFVTSGSGLSMVPRGQGGRDAKPEFTDVGDSPIPGFVRTLVNEYPGRRIRLLDCSGFDQLDQLATDMACELLEPDGETEIILADGGRYCPRVRKLPIQGLGSVSAAVSPVEHAIRLDFPPGGTLKHLYWRSVVLPELSDGQVLIEVRTAGLNFRDVMYAMGILSDEAVENGFAGPTLGMELAGVVLAVGADVVHLKPGDEVIAFAPASFGSRVITLASYVVVKPPELSFESAATIPTAFFTVYYALHHLANLQKGEKILIHGAAGGVGIAALQVARLLGAEIFATAGSEEKRDFLRLMGADHVLSSRSLDFHDEILDLTGGEGVDVVLNSLAGKAMQKSLRALRPFGRFLELGKRDYYENTHIGLKPFRNNIAYFGIDADQLMIVRPEFTQNLFAKVLSLFADGLLKPLPYTVFKARDVVDAFRYMQQSRQIGKIVVSFEAGITDLVPPRNPDRQLVLSGAATYLVTGGLSGFGLKTAYWLAGKGASHLVLVSRSGQLAPEDFSLLHDLRERGVSIEAVACDVADRAQLAALLARLKVASPPLRGVIHSAAIIEDSLACNTNPEQLRRVLAPKILGAIHLDQLTRHMSLDFFVLYSSATTLFGNPGQSSYVAANSFLEGLVVARRTLGLPALCVKWGGIGDTGFLARHSSIRESLQAHMGGELLSSDDALDMLEHFMLGDHSNLALLDMDWRALRRFLPSADVPRFRELAVLYDEGGGERGYADQVALWLEQLTDEELSIRLGDMLKREIGQILRISPASIEDHRSIHDLGMDSLMGTELIVAVDANFGVRLPVMALSEGPTIARIVERIVQQLRDQHGQSDRQTSADQLSDHTLAAIAHHSGEDDLKELEQAGIAVAPDHEPPDRVVEVAPS